LIIQQQHIAPFILEQILGKTTFIVGNAKNAGKTTFLNYLLPLLRETGAFAYTTIGVDGEDFDRITNQRKPQIMAMKDDYVISANQTIQNKGFQIIDTFPFKTSFGQIVLAKATRNTKIELIGVEDNTSLASILESIKNNTNIKTILVDGAINRNTQLTASENNVFLYVASMDSRNKNKVLQELKRLSILNKIEKMNPSTNNYFEIDGALTETKLKEISSENKTLVVADFTKIFLPVQVLQNLLSTRKLFFKTLFPLSFCVLNLKDILRSECDELLADIEFSSNIIFNPYQN
jgi:hypothetical protein